MTTRPQNTSRGGIPTRRRDSAFRPPSTCRQIACGKREMSPKPRITLLLLWPLLSTVFGFTQASATTLSVALSWSAPGDDGWNGRATRYDLRYSTRVITSATFNSARAASGLPTPKLPGGRETYTLRGLAPESTYYAVIKTVDDAAGVRGRSGRRLRYCCAPRSKPGAGTAWSGLRVRDLGPEGPPRPPSRPRRLHRSRERGRAAVESAGRRRRMTPTACPGDIRGHGTCG